MRTGLLFDVDADPDPGYQYDADPDVDPQHEKIIERQTALSTETPYLNFFLRPPREESGLDNDGLLG